jgi:hypothetical protein
MRRAVLLVSAGGEKVQLMPVFSMRAAIAPLPPVG